jgi:hypothetical protein
MLLETCGSLLGRVAIRCSPHSLFGLRRLVFCATPFEQRGWVAAIGYEAEQPRCGTAFSFI